MTHFICIFLVPTVKGWRKVRESITISWEINKKKKELKRNVENWWMVWSLIWLNKSIATINVMFQLLYIYMGNVNKCP